MDHIILKGVREGNLKNFSLEIPRNKLVVLTGLSGSGKSTLAVDVIFKECQRQYLEAIGLQGIRKPDLDQILNASPAVLITQKEYSKNPRSSVGTVTDIYTDLRMLYEKLSHRSCPGCHKEISASNCLEETLKTKDSFQVFMYCNHCNHRMEKLTRTHFSFNTREGACGTCQGLGKVLDINLSRVLHEELSLEAGAVDYWGQQMHKEYQVSSLYQAFRYYGLEVIPDLPVKSYPPEQRALLLYGAESEEVRRLFPDKLPPKTVTEGRFEGVLTTLWRRMADKGGEAKQLEEYFVSCQCPDCRGERLNELSRSVTVQGIRLPEITSISLEELYQWLQKLEADLKSSERQMVEPYLLDLKTKIRRIMNVGLGYLSLDRQTMTLSGGEAQRIKLAATLDSTLTGIIYLLDEPTIGLHPKDTAGIIKLLKELRELNNTVIVIEHDTEVMEAADFIIDIGPGSGKYGGEIIGMGTLEELKEQTSSITGAYLKRGPLGGRTPRIGKGTAIEIRKAELYNLKQIDASFPIGCLISVTGVSGSGKSTLVFEVLAKSENTSGNSLVTGTEDFDRIITVEQSPLARMRRSNIATYSGVYTEIRNIFAGLPEAKDSGLTAKHFSFNTKGGRCESCEGLGFVVSNMLFFEDLEVPCPVCNGKQFNDTVLSVLYQGASIKDVLGMEVSAAKELFGEHPKIMKILMLLEEVGLSYLELGQTLTSLSGGEGQRLKLAVELLSNGDKNNLYLIDEPTTGLHPIDVEHFLILLNKIVDSGSTVIVVEHNLQIIQASDWIIDLGPGGGIDGGNIIATGTPAMLRQNPASVTGRFL